MVYLLTTNVILGSAGLKDVTKGLRSFQLHNCQTLKSNYYREDLPLFQLLNELIGQKYRLISTILQDV